MAQNLDRGTAEWPEVAVRVSLRQALNMAALGVALVILGAALMVVFLPIMQPWSSGWLVVWILGVAVLICMPPYCVYWLIHAFIRGAVVSVGPQGVRDVRVSPDWIPWTAITEVSESTGQGIPARLFLRVDPAFEAAMSLTRVARWDRPFKAMLGLRGLIINAVGLRASYWDLRGAILDGFARTRADREPPRRLEGEVEPSSIAGDRDRADGRSPEKSGQKPSWAQRVIVYLVVIPLGIGLGLMEAFPGSFSDTGRAVFVFLGFILIVLAAVLMIRWRW